ncbi:hypothetical protein [Sphingomonas sp.]|uniref:hypothetical protein n=1 Tax=Sphingomonas sp. TaxID=28214 RepID=UPI00286A576C|nr:hypothetical protein [Sphingomonas sp.]
MAIALTACSRSPADVSACAAPRANWQKPHCIECGLETPRISFEIDRNSNLYQNGKPISLAEMSKQLGEIGKIDNPRIQVQLETEMGASCTTVERVRDLFDQHLQCGEFGQCAEGIKDVWREWPVPPGTPPS